MLLRADSAFYGKPTIGAALRAGAQVSVTVRMTPNIKAAIATIADNAWTAIEYTDAIVDEQTGQLISGAEVAEVPFTAFASGCKEERVTGRRRHPGQPAPVPRDDRHDPARPDRGPGPCRVLSPTDHPAPATGLALGAAVERALQANVWTTPRSFFLTTRRPGPTNDLNIPTSEVGRSATPTPADHQLKIV